jgi:hypothetical protein
MSVACLILSGIEYRTSSDLLGYQVTRPLDIELPRSLVPVVISWNIPIHLWIKNCKSYKTAVLPEKHVVVKIAAQPCGRHMTIFAASLPHDRRMAIFKATYFSGQGLIY